MTQKNKKEFNLWMDTHHDIVAGKENAETTDFTVILTKENTPNKMSYENLAEYTAAKFNKTLSKKLEAV